MGSGVGGKTGGAGTGTNTGTAGIIRLTKEQMASANAAASNAAVTASQLSGMQTADDLPGSRHD